ncbi:hypothetical protein [Methylocystis parvus]|uniref:HNH endonuclease n=1 Tax=Methylocystis parvus TaxID=134 RepID=A0A6B8MDP0_9HYPH|nr:hypothetical protein [Methylocystis parvus]QGM99882.1 hypothetical protein F7D14_19970 [Methylocystis parvus]WBK02305.1 hypothetical protein MMG94_19815 [Methylocystis parvus OBBP]
MIPLVRKRQASAFPKDFLGDRLKAKHLDLVDRYYTSMESDKPIAFASGKWKSAKTKVRADSAKKCAYCEASTSVVAHGDVEHFRPKALYWWLAYDFDNYLFSCQICNQIYKKDFFPVTPENQRLPGPAMPAARPVDPGDLAVLSKALAIDGSLSDDGLVRQRWAAEDADLVHPYLEDPTTIFGYEADDSNEEVWIRPGAHAKSDRAYAAAETYLGLNREELRRDRYHHYSFLAIMKLAMLDNEISQSTRTRILKEFERLADTTAPYAGMNRFFLRAWRIFT